MSILVTGGAGYIGSHTVVELVNAGYTPVVADNFCNSSPLAVKAVEKITGKSIACYDMDVRDKQSLAKVMKDNDVECIIHFAGLKAVGESVQKPVEYYRNNLDTTLSLLEAMKETGVKSIIFSSSATVYGEDAPVPYVETMQRGRCSNPYGYTKSMNEQILEDACKADDELSAVLLRYFNPIGAHETGMIGEDPLGIPNNLMPYIAQVAVGRREKLTVFGNDYPTKDGTCRRDYIHVVDLAKGHVKAVKYALEHKGAEPFNLGTGVPYSVLEVINAFEKASGKDIPFVFGERRAGDLPEFWADSSKARDILGWSAEYGIEKMCADTWNWQSKNPQGYK